MRRRVWQEVTPFFAFPRDMRRIIYAINAIKALNSRLHSVVGAGGHFPRDDGAWKLLYLLLNRSERMEDAAKEMGDGKIAICRSFCRPFPGRKGVN